MLDGLFCDHQGLRMHHAKSYLSPHGHDFHRRLEREVGERDRVIASGARFIALERRITNSDQDNACHYIMLKRSVVKTLI